MTKDIIVTAVAYVVTVSAFIAWIFARKPDRIPRTRRTVLALCLRSLPLFVAFLLVCRLFNATAVFGLVVLVAIAFFTLTSWTIAGLPGLALFYLIQQWILGWPDRQLMFLQPDGQSGDAPSSDPLIGRTARVVAPLRPAGKVAVDDTEVDASCECGFLDAGAEVKLIGKKGFTFIVSPIE